MSVTINYTARVTITLTEGDALNQVYVLCEMTKTEPNKHLRRARARSGLSQASLAEVCGCSRATIIHLEQGRYLPRGDLTLRLAGVLGTTVENLFPPADDDARTVSRKGDPMPEAPTVDPVEFVENALANVPADPAEASLADLHTLGAISAGVYTQISDVYRRSLALGRAAVEGDLTRDEARHELLWLTALGARAELAQQRLADYLHPATQALGVAGAWSAAGVAPPTPTNGPS